MRNFLVFASLGTVLLMMGCAGSGGHLGGNPIPTSGPNVLPIAVNSGPQNNYVNGVFASVTVCVPGSSNCQTINNVLVDTGSSGLRILSSALTLSLPQENGSGGSPLAECAQFVDGITWGSVRMADIKLASEAASSVPIQVIGDPAFSTVPSSCSSHGTPEQTLSQLFANGILGVGSFRQDCGPACTLSGSQNPGFYYLCPSSGCTVTPATLAQQLQNPVWMFPQDNNGVLVALPTVPATGAPSVNGSLVFGIGTEGNNGLGSAQVFTVDPNGNFTTVFSSNSYTGFLDTGSNGLFFLDSKTTGIPTCPSPNTVFYCPSSTQNLSARQVGANGTAASINFSVANADSLFSNSSNFAFNDLGGVNSGVFDWGLPFFFGRNVFTAIELQPTPAGQGPYWAY